MRKQDLDEIPSEIILTSMICLCYDIDLFRVLYYYYLYDGIIRLCNYDHTIKGAISKKLYLGKIAWRVRGLV